MNFGFNSNVRAGETTYHVQSEDRGSSHPYFDTVIYEAGRVIYKRSTSYEDFASAAKGADLSKQLHERLARQHREVIAELEAGTLPLNLQPKAHVHASPIPASDGLDVRLENPKTWFELGCATLEIELRQRSTGGEIGGADVEAFLERESNRTLCLRMRTDATGRATLKFPVPPTAGKGTALVIRATDGLLYGELRFLLKAKPRDPAPAAASQ
jgi:hypothetical protein